MGVHERRERERNQLADAALGHRILEVAAVELVDRRLTGNHLHRYINPQRPSDEGALQVHGLTEEFLRDKPKFGEIARELLDFINGAELVIHNASFDLSFLDNEFGLLKLKRVKEYCPSVVDTLALARELHPGKRNNLDALCDRYQIDNSKRTLHGALLAEMARVLARHGAANLSLRVAELGDDAALVGAAALD